MVEQFEQIRDSAFENNRLKEFEASWLTKYSEKHEYE